MLKTTIYQKIREYSPERSDSPLAHRFSVRIMSVIAQKEGAGFAAESAGSAKIASWSLLRGLKPFLISLIGFSLILLSPPEIGFAKPRIKDLVDIEGNRQNQLVGYGLVVGLNATGDSLNNSPFTRQSIKTMLERLGVNTQASELKTSNTAAVLVTANLHAFASQGTRIDVSVSALGDATSLVGGTLLVTPLIGADGQTYAVAQGALAVAGFSAAGEAASVTQGVPTSARIANGAIIERELGFRYDQLNNVKLSLRNPDLTTSTRIAETINLFLNQPLAEALDQATVVLNTEGFDNGEIINLLREIEQLRTEPDQVARVVIDESSGLVIIGKHVSVSQVAIAQGNLTISITENPIASQPNPFAPNGETVVLPETSINVDSGQGKNLAIVNDSVSLRDLVNGLNALGVSPRDLITILQAIKAAGALQADIKVL